jgi:hypothetical protein
MMTYGQGFWCAFMGAIIGVIVARRSMSWHLPRCCLCSSRILRDIANAHGAILDLRRSPCLYIEHEGHHHHEEPRPPGPPAGSHP